MFWYLFIFRRHSPRELAYVACDNEHCGLFHGRTRETALIKTNLVSKHEDDLENIEGEQTCKAENGQEKQFLAAGETYVAIF